MLFISDSSNAGRLAGAGFIALSVFGFFERLGRASMAMWVCLPSRTHATSNCRGVLLYFWTHAFLPVPKLDRVGHSRLRGPTEGEGDAKDSKRRREKGQNCRALHVACSPRQAILPSPGTKLLGEVTGRRTARGIWVTVSSSVWFDIRSPIHLGGMTLGVTWATRA